jgi:predicted PolB exonuclease-like 3'-5' exonuclease
MTPILVFDIETIPDLAGLRRTHDIPASLRTTRCSPGTRKGAARRPAAIFVPLHFQRVVAIACALRDEAGFKIGSVGTLDDPEPVLIRRFFDLIDKHTPQLVSWNRRRVRSPVLSYRALVHGVTASRLWDWGDDDREFRYNGYLNRFHTRHLDLMDVLAMLPAARRRGLAAMARVCGFPGKLGMDGGAVHGAVRAGKLDEVRRYCETDVLNTHLLYQRFRLLRGENRSRRVRGRNLACTRADRHDCGAALGRVHRWRGTRTSSLDALVVGARNMFTPRARQLHRPACLTTSLPRARAR